MSSIMPGVFEARKKDGTIYYRSSLTHKGKHISLGSYSTMEDANRAYQEGVILLRDGAYTIDFLPKHFLLPFSKVISLLNLRDNGLYCKNPIYLMPTYFLYYINEQEAYLFDRDDYFFYAAHKIQKRGGYLFICHYGSQYSILKRYGIHQHAVAGRDYIFVNGNPHDYRYSNIRIINHYAGVLSHSKNGIDSYKVYIHVNGNLLVGTYATELEGAIAYNKAADILQSRGFSRQYVKNYIEGLSKHEYKAIYDSLIIADAIASFHL